MELISEFIKTDVFNIIVFCGIALLLVLYLINTIKLSKIRRDYKKFINIF